MAQRPERSLLVAVEAGLVLLAVSCALLFAAWVLGYNGFGVVDGADLPLRLSQATVVPNEPVEVRGPAGVATAAAANSVTGGIPGGEIRPGDGSSAFFGNGSDLSFWALTWSQHLAWVGVRALPALGLAVVWWPLARMVRDQRRGLGFRRRTAARLAGIGALLLVGMPALQIARWFVARWLIDSSSAARIVEQPHLNIQLWPLMASLVILVLASAWRDAARMREDLEGLV